MGITDMHGNPITPEENKRRRNKILSEGGVFFDMHGDHVKISFSEEAAERMTAEAAALGKTLQEYVNELWQAHTEDFLRKNRKK
jgi:hypothetical protein